MSVRAATSSAVGGGGWDHYPPIVQPRDTNLRALPFVALALHSTISAADNGVGLVAPWDCIDRWTRKMTLEPSEQQTFFYLAGQRDDM